MTLEIFSFSKQILKKRSQNLSILTLSKEFEFGLTVREPPCS